MNKMRQVGSLLSMFTPNKKLINPKKQVLAKIQTENNWSMQTKDVRSEL